MSGKKSLRCDKSHPYILLKDIMHRSTPIRDSRFTGHRRPKNRICAVVRTPAHPVVANGSKATQSSVRAFKRSLDNRDETTIHFPLAINRINDDQFGLFPAGVKVSATALFFADVQPTANAGQHRAVLACLRNRSTRWLSSVSRAWLYVRNAGQSVESVTSLFLTRTEKSS